MQPIRALIIEDSEADCALVVRELEKGGYAASVAQVESEAEMIEALSQQDWDVVFSDWALPGFDAIGALAVLRERALDVPLIIVSGSVDDETAVLALRNGARDFVAKDRLARLVPALERELAETRLRRERRDMQHQLAIAERMASIGLIAAGVAHEINNPLAAALANLDVVVSDLSEQRDASAAPNRLDSVLEALADVREAACRIRSIVGDLKLFSRVEEDTKSVVDVSSLLDSALRIAETEIRHRARLVREYAPVPPVEANEARLGQVFVNLIVNAAQAIPEGHAESNEVRVVLRAHGDGVLIELCDTGAGMSPEVQKKLFTPFFTTKPRGVGTGLGLAICHRIVTSLGGEISVESTLGKGSKFKVKLPAARSRSGVRPAVARRRPALRGGRGRVLVVDDDPLIARAMERTLGDEHEVVTVRRGAEALARLHAGERFDVIVCDLMMPEMTGMDLHAHLTRVAPEHAERIIFLTGGAFSPNARGFFESIGNLRLEKPFDADHLRAIIGERVKRAEQKRAAAGAEGS